MSSDILCYPYLLSLSAVTFTDPEIVPGSTSVELQFSDASYPTTRHSYAIATLYLKNTVVALQTLKVYDNDVSKYEFMVHPVLRKYLAP